MKPPGRPTSSSCASPTSARRGLREGWWNWGGLTRAVHLEPVGKVEWRDVGDPVRRRLRQDGDGLPARSRAPTAWLVNHTDGPSTPALTVHADRARRRDLRRRRHRAARARASAGASASRSTIEGKPALWSPDAPEPLRRRTATVAARRHASAGRPPPRRPALRARPATASCSSTATSCSCAARRSRRTSRAAGRRCATQDMEHDRRRPQAPGRERHPRPVPDRRAHPRRGSTRRASWSGARRPSTTRTWR